MPNREYCRHCTAFSKGNCPENEGTSPSDSSAPRIFRGAFILPPAPFSRCLSFVSGAFFAVPFLCQRRLFRSAVPLSAAPFSRCLSFAPGALFAVPFPCQRRLFRSAFPLYAAPFSRFKKEQPRQAAAKKRLRKGAICAGVFLFLNCFRRSLSGRPAWQAAPVGDFPARRPHSNPHGRKFPFRGKTP